MFIGNLEITHGFTLLFMLKNEDQKSFPSAFLEAQASFC